jgi:ABC-type Fe3+/spermidine/putrescine transport system ATPase subunit
MSHVRLQGIVKRYGDVLAARIDELDVSEGEIVALLGPSGCGKTTTLRIVAGLVAQDEGKLHFGDRDVTRVPPERRNAAMVFQNYALFPHMTVYQNIAFGLEVRKFSKTDIAKKVATVLDLVKLPGMGERLPKQLSGGQQQRIAIARALATEPDVLLFDEPLSNLDAKLREYMRVELRNLLVSLKTTTLYVTHDQTEAMVISDRVVVMDRGSIIQVDTPTNVYLRPANRFVAEFVGSGSFIPGQVKSIAGVGEEAVVMTDDGLEIAGSACAPLRVGEKALLCVRPEAVELHRVTAASRSADTGVHAGKIETVADVGELVDYEVRVGRWLVRTRSLSVRERFKQDELVTALLDPARCLVLAA